MKNLIGTAHCGFELVAQKPYSAQEDDGFLSVVGGVREHGSCDWQAVTWVHNALVDGFGHGYYSVPYATRSEALDAMVASFNDRGLGRGLREAHMVEAHKAGVAGERRRSAERG